MDKMAWYALYTRYRHEKSIAAELARQRIESFLPTRTIRRRWSDRTVTIEEPLFKNYLFVKIDPLDKINALKIKGAVNFVSSGTTPIPVDERDISSLKSIVRQEIRIDPFPYLDKGDRVYVKSGIFRDIEGYIVNKDESKCRLVISIAAIKSAISIEIDSCLVEKL